MSEPDPALVRRVDAGKCVPTNWCDPLLSGPNKTLDGTEDCRRIEALLRGVQDRIRALPAAACEKDKRIAALEGFVAHVAKSAQAGFTLRMEAAALAREAPPAEEPARSRVTPTGERTCPCGDDQCAGDLCTPAEAPAPTCDYCTDGKVRWDCGDGCCTSFDDCDECHGTGERPACAAGGA